LREPAAEFFGTMMLIVFGVGGVCQVVLSASTNEYLSINIGWAVGVAMGVWVAGGISGGHINPAVTITLATLRGFPWRKVPYYCFAQLMGALCGAGIIYANYYEAISAYEGGTNIRTVSKTGSLFCTYAADYMTNVGAFFSEFMTSAIMMMCILSFSDKKNGPPPSGTAPISLFILILGVGLALGINTGYAINPARDLGPRIMTAMVGYGKGVFTFRNQYWLWCPVIAPICGCLTGGFVYDLLIFTGSESVVNTPCVFSSLHIFGSWDSGS
ncbi:aquaporin, partial [Coniophora puteana RWD-64-598 SS2]